MVRRALEGLYAVDREIGRGGAARVYLATDLEGKAVALKVLHPELLASVTADRFLREIAVVRRLDHPRIAPLLDMGERDWLIYYVMPFIEGPTLKVVLDRIRRLALPDVERIARELLEALGHAHSLGFVHRDVKPDNVILSPEGAVLVDFGIARAVMVSATDRVTRSGMTVGTSTYMSPEQIVGAPDLDGRSDLYSLGCVLYESVAGRPPFVSGNEASVLQMHQKVEPPDLAELRPEAPERLRRLIMRALRKNPAERWQSAEEMLRELEGRSALT
ncbi:MAG TPA: serine/threonine-protein kinase [Gemmatimonadales bacterium]|jgi:serine/threonine-protein kinase|nr:serine/threonine-protein kinase [Gemmatimonadales bacterium]